MLAYEQGDQIPEGMWFPKVTQRFRTPGSTHLETGSLIQ